ncbi:MAG: hypothetical protein HYZ29_16895 [Myxococcales bacterium]|nr:hypothetical protein [Myxococcales bacterium]
MTRHALVATLALVVAAGQANGQPKPAKAPRAKKAEASGKIKITVVEVAGGRAYIEPGATAGLRTGDTAEVGRKKYSIVAVSPSNAVLELGKLPLETGATGWVVIDPNRAPAKVEPIEAPAPLTSFRSAWSPAQRPAASQRPKPIPLGPITRPESSHVLASLSGYGVVPTGGGEPAWGHGEARAVLHYEPLVELPLSLDVDLSAGAFTGGDFDERAGVASRPLARVRTLQAAYGNDGAFLAALGRLRYASSTLGSVDGLKLHAPLIGGLGVGAFGGFVADPFSGAPSSRVARFGAELAWEAAEAAWRPRAVIGGHASRFEERLDERRLNVLFDLNPDFGRIGTHAEVSFFDRDNEWNAEPTELSAAGADLGFRAGPVDLGGRVAMQRPERSRYLASVLPPEWLCFPRATGAAPEPCFGDEAVYVAGGDAGLTWSNTRLSSGVSLSRTANTDLEQLAGYGNLRLSDIIGRLRVDTGVSGSRGTLLQSAALLVSPGLAFLGGAGDASLRYRPALIRYRASTQVELEHALGGALWLAAGDQLELSLDADWVTGGDLEALLVQSALVWRAGF